MRPIAALAAAAGASAAGLAGLYGYGRWQAEHGFRLRREVLEILPAAAQPITVLHLGDIHLTPGQEHKLRFLRSLAQLRPDVVINTGDNLGHAHVNEELLSALAPLLEIPGAFVFGSNDYYAPQKKNPLHYLLPALAAPRKEPEAPDLPWEQLRTAFSQQWVDLSNATAHFHVNGTELVFSGVDDPHLDRDRYHSFPASSNRAVRIGVAHAPYQRVLDQFAADGAALVFAGHTHGGQWCLPGQHAIVTNCDLPRANASGLFRHGASQVNVSAGIGAAPMAPLRLFCPPEAVLLTLLPRE